MPVVRLAPPRSAARPWRRPGPRSTNGPVGRPGRRPHLLTDVRPAGADQGTAAASGPWHDPEHRPRPCLAGSFIGELKNVTVRQALELILRPLGLAYDIDGTVVRVFMREPETRIFDLNYIATERGASSTVGGSGAAPTGTSLSSATKTDVFDDLAKGVQTLLTRTASFNVDRKAGLLQVTDFPERLDRVSVYLDAVQDRVHRQVQIDALIIEVEPNDEKAVGVDWTALAAQLTGAATPAQRAAPRRR